MANTLFNPAVEGTTFYTAAGTATSGAEFTSHKVLGGAMMGVTSKTSPSVDGVTLGKPASVVYNNNKPYRGFNNGINSVFTTGSIGFVVSESGGKCGFLAITAHGGLTAGKLVQIGPSGSSAVAGGPQMAVNGLYGIHTISGAGANGFNSWTPFIAAYNGTVVEGKIIDTTYNFNTMTAGQYVGQKITTLLAGKSNTSLKFGSNAGMLTRSINKVESVRTTKTLTALRAGSFNRYTGKWTAAVTVSSDGAVTNSTITSDNAAAPSASAPGRITFKEGGKPAPTSTAYAARVTW
jgi:hypothetical protein